MKAYPKNIKWPLSSTNNAIARYDGTTGKIIQDSGAYITDGGNYGGGKTNPQERIDVVGSVRASAPTGTNYVKFGATTNNGYPRASFFLGDADNNYSNGALWVATAGTNQIPATFEALTNSDTSTSNTKRAGMRMLLDKAQLYVARGAGNDSDVPLRIYPNGLSGLASMSFQPNGNIGVNTTAPSQKMDINDSSIRVRTAKTPASASASGNRGQIAWDSNYVYVCTNTNTWKRTAISTW